VLVTLESGIRTGDMMGAKNPASTTDFTAAVIANLGKRSKVSPPKKYTKVTLPTSEIGVNVVAAAQRRVIGVDVYVESELEPKALAKGLAKVSDKSVLKLEMISNRGAMVFPSTERRVSLVDHFRCRFVLRDSGKELGESDILSLLQSIGTEFRWMHVEKLQEFDGEAAFSKSQV